MMPNGIKHLLEVGCGMGLTGKAIKEGDYGCTEVIGIEIEIPFRRLPGKAITNLVREMILKFIKVFGFNCFIQKIEVKITKNYSIYHYH